MLQDFVQVDLLGAGVQKRCVPPFIHTPPPRPVVPRPARTPPPFSRTWEHTGSLHLIFAPPLCSHAAPCPARTPFVPPPFASWVALPIVPCSLPSRVVPCVRPSPDAWPPCTWLPLRGPPIARTPVPPVPLACAQKGWRACGRGGAWGRGAARVEGGGDCPRTGGRRNHPLCLPGMCKGGGRWAG